MVPILGVVRICGILMSKNVYVIIGMYGSAHERKGVCEILTGPTISI